jgi:hypothetical protein
VWFFDTGFRQPRRQTKLLGNLKVDTYYHLSVELSSAPHGFSKVSRVSLRAERKVSPAEKTRFLDAKPASRNDNRDLRFADWQDWYRFFS